MRHHFSVPVMSLQSMETLEAQYLIKSVEFNQLGGYNLIIHDY